jgi:DNA-binding GntR family transcriptional regulator
MADEQNDKSIRQNIYERIRDDITYGNLMPGERLTEKKLSDIYGVSRSPIREALRQLESEGLLSFERNKGIEVRKLSLKQIEDIYESRALLEGYAVRISAQKMDSKDIANLTDIHKKLIKAAKDQDVQFWIKNNALFHGYFREKAGNETISQLIVMLKRRTYHYQNMSVSYERAFETYLEHHAAILDACKKKDAVRAEQSMILHVQTTKRFVIESLSIGRNMLL